MYFLGLAWETRLSNTRPLSMPLTPREKSSALLGVLSRSGPWDQAASLDLPVGVANRAELPVGALPSCRFRWPTRARRPGRLCSSPSHYLQAREQR